MPRWNRIAHQVSVSYSSQAGGCSAALHCADGHKQHTQHPVQTPPALPAAAHLPRGDFTSHRCRPGTAGSRLRSTAAGAAGWLPVKTSRLRRISQWPIDRGQSQHSTTHKTNEPTDLWTCSVGGSWQAAGQLGFLLLQLQTNQTKATGPAASLHVLMRGCWSCWKSHIACFDAVIRQTIG